MQKKKSHRRTILGRLVLPETKVPLEEIHGIYLSLKRLR